MVQKSEKAGNEAENYAKKTLKNTHTHTHTYKFYIYTYYEIKWFE